MAQQPIEQMTDAELATSLESAESRCYYYVAAEGQDWFRERAASDAADARRWLLKQEVARRNSVTVH
jgi:hypothetical protein